MLSPDKDIERSTMYVCGSAGSGKSYFVAQYVQEYHIKKKFKYITMDGVRERLSIISCSTKINND